MTLQQIKYITYVAKYGSISEAAKKLYISQPSLSIAIKKVEAEYGITIFDRSSKGVILSHTGEEFLNDVKHIAEYTEILEIKYCGNTKHRMMFCVASMHYEFALLAFLKLMDEEKGDEYNFGFLECKTLEVMDNVRNGAADMGIICFSRVNAPVVLNEIKNRGLVCYPLIERLPHILMRQGHPLSAKENLSWEDLQDYPALVFYQGVDSSINFSNELIYPIHPKKIIYIADKGTLNAILLSSDAYIVGSGILNRNNFGIYRGISIKAVQDHNLLNIVYITRERSTFSDIDNRYIALLKETIAEDCTMGAPEMEGSPPRLSAVPR